MSRRHMWSITLAALVLLPALACAQEVTSVGVGDWKSGGKGSVNSITIQGEDIYLDGVLQKEKYKPGSDITIKDGKVVVSPHDAAGDARKAEAKARAKAARDAEKESMKARANADKEAMKAELKGGKESAKAQAKAARDAEKEAIKREALEGLEKGSTKTSVGSVVNKGGTVRIGDKVYKDDTPATDKDIPADAKKAIEDAGKLGN